MTDLMIEKSAGVAKVTISRPPVNALTIESYRQITAAFSALDTDDEVRCIILTGAGGRAFCAGFDFRQFADAGAQEDDPKRPEILRVMFETIRRCSVPVIGAINGAAIGAGCVLAAVCDIRVASEAARFGLPEIDFGRVGGGAYLGRLVPAGVLRRMTFTGQPITAGQALAVGLADELVPVDSLTATVDALAAVIAAKPLAALRHMKAALNRIETLSADEGYRVEQEFSVRLQLLLKEGAR